MYPAEGTGVVRLRFNMVKWETIRLTNVLQLHKSRRILISLFLIKKNRATFISKKFKLSVSAKGSDKHFTDIKRIDCIIFTHTDPCILNV